MCFYNSVCEIICACVFVGMVQIHCHSIDKECSCFTLVPVCSLTILVSLFVDVYVFMRKLKFCISVCMFKMYTGISLCYIVFSLTLVNHTVHWCLINFCASYKIK